MSVEQRSGTQGEAPGDANTVLLQRSRRNVGTPLVHDWQSHCVSHYSSYQRGSWPQQFHKAVDKVGWHLVAISKRLQCVRGLRDPGAPFVRSSRCPSFRLLDFYHVCKVIGVNPIKTSAWYSQAIETHCGHSSRIDNPCTGSFFVVVAVRAVAGKISTRLTTEGFMEPRANRARALSLSNNVRALFKRNSEDHHTSCRPCVNSSESAVRSVIELFICSHA